MRIRARAYRTFGATDGVELSTDGVPIAFRIWKAGANPTDHGVHIFSRTSSERLMADQVIRGNLYSIDVDHLSLDDKSPPESHKAVGWHRLESRQSAEGPELWAVDVQWTAPVRASFVQAAQGGAPEWRYFSPAYDVQKETREICRYLNTALTNNPATWSVTALASRTEKASMKFKDILADLMGSDEEKKNAAIAHLAAAFPEEEPEPKDGKGKEAATKATEDDKKKEEAKKASEDEAAKKATAVDDEKKDEQAKANVALAKRVQELEAAASTEKASRAAEKEQEKRATLLAKRPDFGAEVRATLAKVSLPELEEAVAKWPRVQATAQSSVHAQMVGGERGADGGGATRYVPRLNAEERASLRGLSTAHTPDDLRAHRVGTTLVMPRATPTREQANKRLAELETELVEIEKEFA